MTAEGTACNGAGEAPKAEFSPEKAMAAPAEEKAASPREGEDVGGPFVIVNGGDSDGHSDRGSDLGKAADEDSPSEEEDAPATGADAGGDHGATAGGEVGAPGVALGASTADGGDRAADGSEGGVDEGQGEPSSGVVAEVAQQEAADEEHDGAAAPASSGSGSDPAVAGPDSEVPAVDSGVEGKEDTADESATDVAESVVHEAASNSGVEGKEDTADESSATDVADSVVHEAASNSGVEGKEDTADESSATDVAESVVHEAASNSGVEGKEDTVDESAATDVAQSVVHEAASNFGVEGKEDTADESAATDVAESVVHEAASDSGVEGKEDTADESAATDVAESVVHEAASKEQDGEDSAAKSCGHDDALTSAKSSSSVVEYEVNGEDSKEEQSAADVAEPVEQGTGGESDLVENGRSCANTTRAGSLEAATEPENQEDVAVESLGHYDAPISAESDSAPVELEVNEEDSKEEESAADVVEPVEEGTYGASSLMANGHVCANTMVDSFEASTQPDSHANESKLEQNATEVADSMEEDAACEDGIDASKTNGHICATMSADSCLVASQSEVPAIETEGPETDRQEEEDPTNEAEVLGQLEASDRNCSCGVEEIIEEEVDAGGCNTAEGIADASGEQEAMAKQVEGEFTCGILQLEEKLGEDGIDSSCDDSLPVELPVEKGINEAVLGICEPEEVTKNTSQETVLGDGLVKDGVYICTLHSLKPESDPSFKSSLQHEVQAEVATVDETAAKSDLKADNVVEAKIATHGVEETEVKAEADLTPFSSQQNCESSTETVVCEKVEAPAVENGVAEVELKELVETEVLEAVPSQEAADSAVSTFHNEERSIDLVDSDSINHSSPANELKSYDYVHIEESRSRDISKATVEQVVCGASSEHRTMVDDEAKIIPETENGSQEKCSDAAVDQGESVDLNVDEPNVVDKAVSIFKENESSDIVDGSTSQENQSKICNASATSDEDSTRTGNEIPSPINQIDETCNGTCPVNDEDSTRTGNEIPSPINQIDETCNGTCPVNVNVCTSSDEVENKCLEELKDDGERAPAELHGDHTEVVGPVYIIKVPRFTGEDLWAKTQAAQAHLDQLTQKRDAINRRKQEQKAVCDQYREKLEAARRVEREARAAHGEKKNDLNSLRSVIGKMQQANSIEEIDETIAMKERNMQHVTISLSDEKALIKEIHDLKAQRKQLASNIGSKAEINEAINQKDHIHERHKALKKDSDVLFTNLKSLEENTRKILKSLDDERGALKKLNEEYRAANDLRQKAYSEWSELKQEPNKKNQYFFAYRASRNTADTLKMDGDVRRLQSHCKDQIERVMEMWNRDEDFRKQYVEANKISTLKRFGTLDGRRLGPDEDPPVIPSRRPMFTSPLTASSPDVPTVTSVPAPVLAAPASASIPAKEDSFPVLPSPQISKRAKSKASGGSTQNENNAVTASEAEDIKQAEKEKVRLEEELELARKAEELARKEEELRKERAAAEKERLRLEQKAKAKEAEERKRRKAEKEKERAEFKARKEAEEREKKKAKKDKKKGSTPVDPSTVGESNAAALATADTDSNASDNSREVDVPQPTPPKRLSKPAAAIKQLNRVQPMPAPLRNRGRRKMRQYILIAAAVLSVLALFVAGNYIPRLKSLHQ
ncbi:unnamed protein product [Urochloa humidicola]